MPGTFLSTTLLGVIQNRGPLELSEAREIASQFLAGLEAGDYMLTFKLNGGKRNILAGNLV